MGVEIQKPQINPAEQTQPVLRGGSGGMTPSQAGSNLGFILNSQKDIANGVMGLDASAKINPSRFVSGSGYNSANVDGQLIVSTNSSTQLSITDYDSARSYSIAVSAGSVTQNGDTLTFVAPGSVQTVNLTINGRVIPITVNAPQPAKPTITSPIDQSVNLTVHGVSLTGSAFSPMGDSSTHLGSDWQLATDSAFASIVQSVTADTNNKTSWTTNALNSNTTYYARVRYKGSNGNYSQYSDTLIFTTQIYTLITTEEAILSASDRAATAYFGFNVCINSDGTRVIVGARQATSGGISNAGQAYVFLRTGTSWAQEQILFASDRGNNFQFGTAVSINSDMSRCVIGAYNATSGGFTGAGQAYVFTRAGTVWSQEQILFASDRAANFTFGIYVEINSDASRIISSSHQTSSGGFTNAGQAYIFSRFGTVWTQEAILFASDRATSAYFGVSIGINNDGSRVIVGAQGATSGGLSSAGQAYVFVRAGTIWTQEAILFASDRIASGNFGTSSTITGDASRVAIGATGATSNSLANAGQCYVFLRTGTSWAQEQILFASDRTTGWQFGLSVSVSNDGTRIAVGSRYATSGGLAQAGQVYVFSRGNVTWSQESILSASDKAASAMFGYSTKLNYDGTRLISSALQATSGSFTLAGQAYIKR